MKYDVIIIGSGMSGLTSALKLSKAGKKVAVIEKHFMPGGYATNFSRKGKDGNIYNFDVSLHSLSGMNEGCETRKIFEELGVNDLSFLKLKEPLALIKNDREVVKIPNDKDEYKDLLIKRYPNHEDGINKLFMFMENLIKNSSHDSNLDTISVKDFLKIYINNDDFIEEFCYLWVYIGLPIDKVNAYYSMQVISRYIFGGHSYVKGGSGQFSKTLSNHIKNNGGDIFLSSEVIKIDTKNNKVISVTTNKGDTFTADEFIFACDPNHIFSLIDSPIKNDYLKNISNCEKSPGVLQLYLGIDCPTKNLRIENSHIFYYNNLNSNELYKCFEDGNIEQAGFVIVAYDKLDPDLNNGKAYLNMAMLDFAHNWPERGTEEYETKKQYVIDVMLKKLFNLYPKVKGHIQAIELGTPRTTQRYTNNSDGAIYGLAQNIRQGGFKRTSFKTPFDNAIVVGAWSYPGGGYEGAILSGSYGSTRLLNKRVISNENKIIPINQLMNGLIRKFNPENAEGLNITYKFLFEGYDPIYLKIKNKTAKLLPKLETTEKIDTALSMSHETWYKISFNKISGQDALMDGLVKCEGNLKNFASIPKIFNKSL